MAVLNLKEFAALCHTSEAVVRTNKARKKVVMVDGYIDTEDPLNQKFFNRYNQKFQKAQSKAKKEVEETPVSKPKPAPKPSTEKLKKSRTQSSKKIDWVERKQKAEAVYKERQAELQLVQLEKLAGKLIPTDLVFNIMMVHNKSIFAEFQNELENLASIYCDILAGGDRKHLAKINQKLSIQLEKSIKKAKKVAKKSINNAVKEYSKTRNRGERK